MDHLPETMSSIKDSGSTFSRLVVSQFEGGVDTFFPKLVMLLSKGGMVNQRFGAKTLPRVVPRQQIMRS